MSDIRLIEEQIVDLAGRLEGPFPYADCRLVLQQVREEAKGPAVLENLIPDLDAYFYMVAAHATGVHHVSQWDGERLAQSCKTLDRSFFQMHRKYRFLEWRINELNVPHLYRKLTVHNELRLLVIAYIDQLLQKEREKNRALQERYLLSPA